MSNITPFSFESHSVQVVIDDHGDPWFVAKEVSSALGYSDAEAMTRRLDEDEKQNLQLVGFGPRGVTVINESGLYTAVLGSTKPEAKRFKKWVTSEVLPSIRKTGSYETPKKKRSLPHARTIDLIQSTADLLMRIVPTIDRNILAVQTVETIQRNTGLDVTPMRSALGEVASSAPTLNSTELGARFGLSAREINRWLKEMSYIVRVDNEWVLTPHGEKLGGRLVPYTAPNGHSGYQLLWSESAANTMGEIMDIDPDAARRIIS